MKGTARLSPKSRGIADIERRVQRLEMYGAWRHPHRVDFEKLVGPELWKQHTQNWRDVLEILRTSQELTARIRAVVEKEVLGQPQSSSRAPDSPATSGLLAP